MRGPPLYFGIAEHDAAAIDRHEARDGINKSGFTSTIRANDGGYTASLEAERHLREGVHATETHTDVFHRKESHLGLLRRTLTRMPASFCDPDQICSDTG